MEDSVVLYREANLFSHAGVWLGSFALMFASVYFALPQIFEMASDKPPSTLVIVGSCLFIAVGFISPALLLAIKLRIQVRSDGLYVKLAPFQSSFRSIPLAGLKDCKPYIPQGKENRLDLRHALSKNAYSLGGNKGILMEFGDGRTVLLETKHPEKIIEAINEANSRT